jgi:hypothetical protein
MNLETLKKVIREEVRTVFKEELQEVLTEAVRIASTPTKEEVSQYTPPQTTTAVKSQLREEFKTINPIEKMLEETKLSFTSQDAKNFYGGSEAVNPRAAAMAHSMGMAGDFPGVDLSSLPFLKNAKNILDKTKEIDKGKTGGY